MSRQKSPKADNLTTARQALTKAMTMYDDAVADLDLRVNAKDHPGALAAFKTAHERCLETKDLLNGLYSHIAELRPKTEPKPPRKDKGKDMKPGDYTATMGPKGVITDVKKVRPRRENHAEPERDEASSDEPSDPDSV